MDRYKQQEEYQRYWATEGEKIEAQEAYRKERNSPEYHIPLLEARGLVLGIDFTRENAIELSKSLMRAESRERRGLK